VESGVLMHFEISMPRTKLGTILVSVREYPTGKVRTFRVKNIDIKVPVRVDATSTTLYFEMIGPISTANYSIDEEGVMTIG